LAHKIINKKKILINMKKIKETFTLHHNNHIIKMEVNKKKKNGKINMNKKYNKNIKDYPLKRTKNNKYQIFKIIKKYKMINNKIINMNSLIFLMKNIKKQKFI
jgi:hypothetical protein